MHDPLGFFTPRVRQYVEREAPYISGWLHRVAEWAFAIIDGVQRQRGTQGGYVEIGTWHGKTLLLLAHLATREESVVGIDVALKAELLENLRRFGFEDWIQVRKEDSTQLTAANILELSKGGIRVFHIDGSHHEAAVTHDLSMAFASVSAGGLVALDDFFSATLPGVTSGVFRCFQEGANNGFVPFLLAGNKCWFARSDDAAAFQTALLAEMPIKPLAVANEPLLGGAVVTYDF